MSDFKKEEKSSRRYEPSMREMNDLSVELRRFPQKLVNTRLCSPFELYLLSLNVVSVSTTGQLVCHDPVGYERLSKTSARLELREAHADEALFQQFPEERKAFATKMHSLRSKMNL